MKIGILTFHRSHNYGAVLQAFALMSTLKKMGHDVEFIDYWPDYREGQYDVFDLQVDPAKKDATVAAKAKRLIKQVISIPYWYAKHAKFESFIKNNLGVKSASVSSGSAIPDKYDAVVCGSDQIWRYNFRGTGGFDEVYFAKYPVSKKALKISYAASMGDKDLGENAKKALPELINNFDSISVREESLLEPVKLFARKPPVKVVDPVFLLTESEWRKMLKPNTNKKKYLLFYELLHSADAKKLARKIAKERNLEIVDIRGAKENVKPFNSKSSNHTAGPIDFITLIANADYIVSTSYHGVAFSIIFQKPFAAIGFKSKGHRIRSLLKNLEIEQCLVENVSDPLPVDVDYSNVHLKLEELKRDSLNYLSNSIITK